MGIVASQSFKNIISTYSGFAIGAINTLFLYTEFMSDEYYGMVGYMLSLAYVVMPLLAFGVHNTLVKFYSSFKTRTALNSFLTLMLFMPLLLILPLVLLNLVAHDAIAGFLSKRNAIIKGYLWHTLVISIALAYFEIFFSWAKVQMQTVFGNFMKEVFHRAGTMVLLFSLYFKLISLEQFMFGLVVVYLLRMLVMMLYAFSIKLPVVAFQKVVGIKDILGYSLLIIIAGSIATVLLDIDKVMLGYYIPIKEIAYYNVAIFIATVIAVPQRAMHQILLPLSAKFLNEKDFAALGDLYKKSSLNLFIVAGLVFLLIILNVKQLYLIIPEEFSGGLFVVSVISLAKLYDALMGNNNAILFNSDYYKTVLLLGVILVIVMVVLNMLLIPLLGINGAALATFLAIFLYNTIKMVFVYKVFGILPFTASTLNVAVVLGAMAVSAYFWDLGFHPILNILVKSLLIVIVYCGIVYKMHLSADINSMINSVIKKRF